MLPHESREKTEVFDIKKKLRRRWGLSLDFPAKLNRPIRFGKIKLEERENILGPSTGVVKLVYQVTFGLAGL